MRTHLLIGTAVMAFQAPAVAADVPVAPYPLPPPPVVSEPWSGFYLGVDAGYSFSPWRSSSTAPLFFIGSGFAAEETARAEGWLAGAHIGFNCLVDGTWLWGFEADIAGSGVAASLNGFWSASIPTVDNLFNVVNTQTTSNHWSSSWYATVRGRIGGLASPVALVYVTAGVAFAQFHFSTQTTTTAQLFGPGPTGTLAFGPLLTTVSPTFDGSATRVGGALGIGVEYKISRSWSSRLEYLYLDFGSSDFLATTGYLTTVRLHENVIRGGLSYTFN